jgi:hypothetical protein
MAKKKKTQLKPVARGFATVSVPKKVVPTEEAEPKVAEASKPNPVKDGTVNGEDRKEQGHSAGQNGVTQDEFDPEKMGEQSLQSFVDRLQEKTEKDIVR